MSLGGCGPHSQEFLGFEQFPTTLDDSLSIHSTDAVVWQSVLRHRDIFLYQNQDLVQDE
jgi:hypothetical protein